MLECTNKFCHNHFDVINICAFSDRKIKNCCFKDKWDAFKKHKAEKEEEAWKEYSEGEEAERRFDYKEASGFYRSAFIMLSGEE